MQTTQSNISYQQELWAAGLVFSGAILFSAKAVMVKLAYQHEIDSLSLLSLRMLLSLPIFLSVAYFSNKGKPKEVSFNRKDLIFTCSLGIAGYYVASLTDFMGLQYISASLERLVLFMYPTLVLLISALIFKEKITRIHVIALILTYIGIAIALLENFNIGGNQNFLLGVGLVFISALTFAIYISGSGQLVPKLGTLRYTSYAMISATVGILIHHGIAYQWDLFNFSWEIYQLAILIAIFSTALPSFMVSEGIRIIGASKAAIIGGIGPISTIVLAYIFLGERLGPLQWVGTLLVIGGVLLISIYKR